LRATTPPAKTRPIKYFAERGLCCAQGSQRQLAHVGREQVRLLNKWTRTFAARLALESDSPPAANTAPVTLASAEAPFADPFLMEFEDSMALKQAYSEAPVTFEQALLAARLEAKNAAEQVC
jgi:hypothetical protein